MRRTAVEKKALEILRNTVGLQKPPVDVKKIASLLGADCREAALPDETSGVLEKKPEGHHKILVNKDHASVRRRFTIAHELGHLVLSQRNGIYIDKRIFFRNGRSQQAIDPEEITANAFAAELLMPTPLIRRSFNRYAVNGFFDAGSDVVADLADEFKVSTTAMSIKLQNLGLSF